MSVLAKAPFLYLFYTYFWEYILIEIDENVEVDINVGVDIMFKFLGTLKSVIEPTCFLKTGI